MCAHNAITTGATRADSIACIVELVVAPPKQGNCIAARTEPTSVVAFSSGMGGRPVEKVHGNDCEVESKINWVACHRVELGSVSRKSVRSGLARNRAKYVSFCKTKGAAVDSSKTVADRDGFGGEGSHGRKSFRKGRNRQRQIPAALRRSHHGSIPPPGTSTPGLRPARRSGGKNAQKPRKTAKGPCFCQFP